MDVTGRASGTLSCGEDIAVGERMREPEERAPGISGEDDSGEMALVGVLGRTSNGDHRICAVANINMNKISGYDDCS